MIVKPSVITVEETETKIIKTKEPKEIKEVLGSVKEDVLDTVKIEPVLNNEIKIKTKKDRSSPIHREQVRIFAEYLWYVIKNSKQTIKVDLTRLVNYTYLSQGLKLQTEEGQKEYFIRRVVATYEIETQKKVERQGIKEPKIIITYTNKEEIEELKSLLSKEE